MSISIRRIISIFPYKSKVLTDFSFGLISSSNLLNANKLFYFTRW